MIPNALHTRTRNHHPVLHILLMLLWPATTAGGADLTIHRPGAAASSWDPSYSWYSTSTSQWPTDGGVELGGFWNSSKPTYIFLMPPPVLAAGTRELTRLQIWVDGDGGSWRPSPARLIVESPVQPHRQILPSGKTRTLALDLSGTEAQSVLFSGTAGHYDLRVTIEAIEGRWYDLHSIDVVLTYAGIPATWLNAYLVSHGAAESLQTFDQTIGVRWDVSV